MAEGGQEASSSTVRFFQRIFASGPRDERDNERIRRFPVNERIREEEEIRRDRRDRQNVIVENFLTKGYGLSLIHI